MNRGFYEKSEYTFLFEANDIMFKKFSSVFYVAIVAALFLAGCGYKGAPVYKENNKTIDYNVTQSSDSSSRM